MKQVISNKELESLKTETLSFLSDKLFEFNSNLKAELLIGMHRSFDLIAIQFLHINDSEKFTHQTLDNKILTVLRVSKDCGLIQYEKFCLHCCEVLGISAEKQQ